MITYLFFIFFLGILRYIYFKNGTPKDTREALSKPYKKISDRPVLYFYNAKDEEEFSVREREFLIAYYDGKVKSIIDLSEDDIKFLQDFKSD